MTGTILIATDVTVAGGVDVYVQTLSDALSAAGREVHVVAEMTSTSTLLTGTQAVPVHRIRLHHRTHEPAAIESDVAALLARLRPDGVHVVCGVPWSCLTLRQVTVDLNVPLMVTEQFVPEDLRLGAGQLREVRRTYAAARRVIFVSDGNRWRLQQAVGLEGVAAEVIPNAVPVSAIRRRSLPIDERARRLRRRLKRDPLHVVTAARLSPEKGIDDLIAALSLLAPGTVKLSVLGAGPLRSALEQQAAGLAVAVRFGGWSQDVIADLRDADVFVLPSHHEGMPFSLLEAMAAGVPAIASRTPGSAEALEYGRAGLLFDPGNRPGLAESIVAIGQYPDQAISRAVVAQEVVARSHDLEVAMDRTVAMWQDYLP